MVLYVHPAVESEIDLKKHLKWNRVRKLSCNPKYKYIIYMQVS
jgi:hypothetical protein